MNLIKKLNRNTLLVAVLFVFVFSQFTGCKEEDPIPSDSKQITAFVFADLNPVTTGTIDESKHTISLEVPVDTDIISLVPTITTSDKATVSPASGIAANFTSPVTYTVTAEDGSTQTYMVTVVSPDKKITSFKFEGLSPAVEGTIDEDSHSILLKVPYNTDVTALTPSILIRGKETSPATGTAQDFTTPATYTVTATNGSTQTYTVKVEVMPINTASIKWTSAGYNFNGTYSLATLGKDIFVGSWEGVSRSSDGSSWTKVATGLSIVRTVIVNGNNVYAGTNSGIYLLSNNGTTWSPLLTVPAERNIFSILVNGSTIFASSFDGIYLSTNNGTDWDLVNNGLTSLNVISLGTSGSNLFAGAPTSNVSFLSTNAGGSWAPISTLPGAVAFTAIGNNSFAATQSGVYTSADNGVTWTAVNSGLTDLNVHSLFSKDGNLFAGTSNGVFLSPNEGNSWISISSGLPNESILAIAIKGSTIFAATFYGVYSSPL